MFKKLYKESVILLCGFMLALVLLGYQYNKSIAELQNIKSGIYIVIKKSKTNSIPSKMLVKKSRCYIALDQKNILEGVGSYFVKIPVSKIPLKVLSQILKIKVNYITNVHKNMKECHANHFVFYSY